MVSVEEARKEIYGIFDKGSVGSEAMKVEEVIPEKMEKTRKARKVRTGRWNSIGITDKERIRIMNKVRMRCYVMLSQLYKEEYKDLVNEERNKEYEKLREKFEKKNENIESIENTERTEIVPQDL